MSERTKTESGKAGHPKSFFGLLCTDAFTCTHMCIYAIHILHAYMIYTEIPRHEFAKKTRNEVVIWIKISKFLFKQAALFYTLTAFPYLMNNQVNVVLNDLSQL